MKHLLRQQSVLTSLIEPNAHLMRQALLRLSATAVRPSTPSTQFAPPLASVSGSALTASALTSVTSLTDLELAFTHQLPAVLMSNYVDFTARRNALPSAPSAPLRELDQAPVRLHTFGNPFKVNKVGIFIFILFIIY